MSASFVPIPEMDIFFGLQIVGLDVPTVYTNPAILVSLRQALACLGMYSVTVYNATSGQNVTYNLPPQVYVINMLNIANVNGVIIGLDANGDVPVYTETTVPTNGNVTYWAANPYQTKDDVTANPDLVNQQGYPWLLQNTTFNSNITVNNNTCGATTAYSNLIPAARRLFGVITVGSISRRLIIDDYGQLRLVSNAESLPDYIEEAQPVSSTVVRSAPRRLQTDNTTIAKSVNITFQMILPSTPLALMQAMLDGLINASSVVPNDVTTHNSLTDAVDEGQSNRNILTLVQQDIAVQTHAQLAKLSAAMNSGNIANVPIFSNVLATVSNATSNCTSGAAVPCNSTTTVSWTMGGADSIVLAYPTSTATGTTSTTSAPSASHTRSGTPSRTLSHTVGASPSITQSVPPEAVVVAPASNAGAAAGAALGVIALLIIGCCFYFTFAYRKARSDLHAQNAAMVRAGDGNPTKFVVHNPFVRAAIALTGKPGLQFVRSKVTPTRVGAQLVTSNPLHGGEGPHPLDPLGVRLVTLRNYDNDEVEPVRWTKMSDVFHVNGVEGGTAPRRQPTPHSGVPFFSTQGDRRSDMTAAVAVPSVQPLAVEKISPAWARMASLRLPSLLEEGAETAPVERTSSPKKLAAASPGRITLNPLRTPTQGSPRRGAATPVSASAATPAAAPLAPGTQGKLKLIKSAGVRQADGATVYPTNDPTISVRIAVDGTKTKVRHPAAAAPGVAESPPAAPVVSRVAVRPLVFVAPPAADPVPPAADTQQPAVSAKKKVVVRRDEGVVQPDVSGCVGCVCCLSRWVHRLTSSPPPPSPRAPPSTPPTTPPS